MKQALDRFMRDSRTELVLIGLILISVTLLIVEIGLDASGTAYSRVHLAGEIITGVFVVELLIRFWIAPKKGRFFSQYWVDLVSVLPLFRPLRFLRVVRLIRLHRVGILVFRRLQQYSPTLAAGFVMQLMIFLTIGIIVLIGGIAIHHFEGAPKHSPFHTLGDSLWWSLFTLISVQPTLANPQTEMGRIIAAFVVMGGLATVAVFTGVMSAVMVQRLRLGLEVTDLELDDLRDHVIICGWNRAAPLIIQELHQAPPLQLQSVVVVAEFDEVPEADLKKVDRTRVYFHKGDYTSLDVLETAGIRHAKHAILLADKCKPRSDQDRDARTVLAALTIEKLNPRIFTCAQLLDRKNNVQLQVAGVENVVIDDEVGGTLIATSIRNHGLVGVITELLDASVGNNLFKIPLPKSWAGITVGEASQRLRSGHQAILVGLECPGNGRRGADKQSIETVVNPPDAQVIAEKDELVVIALKEPNLT